MSTSAILNETRGKRVCSRFGSLVARAAQERSEFSSTGDRQGIQKPYNGHCSQRRSANKCGNKAVHVYDLDLFLTMQILEDTPAVQSPGKLCEDHGYSNEWTSGQKTHLIKIGRKYSATRRITNPSLCRACQPSSCTSTSSSSVPQDSMRDDSAPSPATARSRSTRSRALGDQLRDSTENKTKKVDIDTARGSPLRDLTKMVGGIH